MLCVARADRTPAQQDGCDGCDGCEKMQNVLSFTSLRMFAHMCTIITHLLISPAVLVFPPDLLDMDDASTYKDLVVSAVSGW